MSATSLNQPGAIRVRKTAALLNSEVRSGACPAQADMSQRQSIAGNAMAVQVFRAGPKYTHEKH